MNGECNTPRWPGHAPAVYYSKYFTGRLGWVSYIVIGQALDGVRGAAGQALTSLDEAAEENGGSVVSQAAQVLPFVEVAILLLTSHGY